MESIVRIKLATGYLDVEPKTVFPLNFGVSDIRDVTEKSGTFSKSITLSGTKNNHKLLNHYFDYNIQAGTFDINKITQCTVIKNGIVILDNATLQLVSLNKKQLNGSTDESVTYTVIIKDSTSNFFKEINNKMLTDLDFSYLNHNFTADNVISSFDNTIAEGFKYLMPHNPGVSDDAQFKLEEFTPCIYAKKYFDSIFARSGFGYNWPESTGSTIQFEKLVVPYNGDKFIPSKENVIGVIAESTGSTTYGGSSLIPAGQYYSFIENNPIKLNNEIVDINNDFNPVTSKYTVPNIPNQNSNIIFEYDVNYEVYLVNSSGANAYVKPLNPNATNKRGIKINPKIKVIQNGVTFFPSNFLINEIWLNSDTTILNGTTVYGNGTSTITTNVPTFVPGYNYWLGFEAEVKGYDTNGNLQDYRFYTTPTGTVGANVKIYYKINSIQLRINPQLSNFGYNVPVIMNKFIPKQVKQSDFIKSIFTMYNLFAEVDKDNPKVLNLTTRDKYYDSGEVVDLTKKQSKERETELRFLPELQTKKIVLTYKEDKDIANTTYQATNEVYGQLEYIFDNEYVRETTKKELIFGPSPVHNTNFGAVLPMVNGEAPKTLPRILFDGGQYTCGNYTIENYPGNIVSGQTYPHLSHWDKPTNPTLDINFGTCDFYFRTDDFGNNTNNTLFNLFWRRTMNQINTGKMLTSYFDLNERDIQNLKLNCKVKIDNSYFNINKVIDYDANSNSLTKVELISVDDNIKIPFNRRQLTNIERGSYLIYKPVSEITKERNILQNIVYTNNDVNISGINNIVGETVKEAFILGNNNNIFESAVVLGDNNIVETTASVFGSNNIVNGEAEGSFVLGNSITADTASTLFVPNLTISSGGLINGIDVSSVTLFSGSTGANSIIANNGTGNIASGNYAFAEGNSNIASGNYSHAEGNDTAATGDYSHAKGYRTLANGDYSHAEGNYTQASGDYSHAEGKSVIARNYNENARGDSNFSYGVVNFWGITINATPKEIFLDGNSEKFRTPASFYRLGFTCEVIAANGADLKTWKIDGLASVNIGGVVIFQSAPIITNIFSTGSLASANISLVAGTNYDIYPVVTGVVATNIEWNFVFRYFSV